MSSKACFWTSFTTHVDAWLISSHEIKPLRGNSDWSFPALCKNLTLQKILNLNHQAIAFSSLIHEEKYVNRSWREHFAFLASIMVESLYLRVICATEDTFPGISGRCWLCFHKKSGPLNDISALWQCNNVSPRDATSAGFLFESTYRHCDGSELSYIVEKRFATNVEISNWHGWSEVTHHLLSTEARFDSVHLLWLWTSPLCLKTLCHPETMLNQHTILPQILDWMTVAAAFANRIARNERNTEFSLSLLQGFKCSSGSNKTQTRPVFKAHGWLWKSNLVSYTRCAVGVSAPVKSSTWPEDTSTNRMSFRCSYIDTSSSRGQLSLTLGRKDTSANRMPFRYSYIVVNRENIRNRNHIRFVRTSNCMRYRITMLSCIPFTPEMIFVVGRPCICSLSHASSLAKRRPGWFPWNYAHVFRESLLAVFVQKCVMRLAALLAFRRTSAITREMVSTKAFETQLMFDKKF